MSDHSTSNFSAPEIQAAPPSSAPQAVKRSNGVGTAALVVGIVAVVLAVIPFLGMVSFFLGPVALILGVVGLVLKFRKKSGAIAGLILGVVSLIIAGIVTSAMSAGVKTATDAAIPTVPPAAQASAAVKDNPDATKSDRGNIIRAVGQGAGLSDGDGRQAISFVVNKITVDPVCDGKYPRPAVNGHFLALNISAQTYAPLKDLFGSGTFDFGGHNWKLIAPNGTTFNGDVSSGPALSCLTDAESLPGRVGTGENVTGTLILDVPSTEGTLVFDPTFADASWEWAYPAS